MTSAPNGHKAEQDMLVIQFGDRTVKGYTDRSQWPAAEDINFHKAPPVFQRLGSDTLEEIPLDGVKAIFFVKSFEGKWHDDLRFHDHLPAPECLWVRATFHDGEVIEGLIGNNPNYVILPGFYMSAWHGLWVPKGTAPATVAKINAAVVKVLADPRVRDKLQKLGQEIPPRAEQTPKGLVARQHAEIETWRPIIKAAQASSH